MKTGKLWRKIFQSTLACGFVLGIGLLLLGYSHDIQAGETTLKEHKQMVQAYSLFKEKCLGCHLDVSDPEKEGKTKDEWYIVVNLMEGHGVNITPADSETLVGLLFKLRPGLEKDPG